MTIPYIPISGLPNLPAAQVLPDDIVPIVDVSDLTDAATGTTKKTPIGQYVGLIGLPIVADDAARASTFPTPMLNQRVQNLADQEIQRWNGTSWGTDFYGTAVVNAAIAAGIPIVADAAARDARFPSPVLNQRVYRVDTGNIERWNGDDWIIAITATPRTITSVASGVDRDTLFPTPTIGQLVYRQDTQNTESWNGTAWIIIYIPASALAEGIIGYATLADLEAVTPVTDGVLAWVTNDPTPANNGMYRWQSPDWILSDDRVSVLEADITALQTDVGELQTAFDIVPPKNKYDPSLAVDGQVYNFIGGLPVAFATSILSGHIPVVEDTTYTISQPSPEKGFFGEVFCYDASHAYLGMSTSVSGSPLVAGMNRVQKDPGGTGGYRQLTFTVPAASGVAFVAFNALYNYAAHTTPDFNRIRNSIQLEIGTVATPFVPYTPNNSLVIKETSVPETIQRSAPAAPVLDAFDIVPTVNLYDLSNAVDGNLIQYFDGTNSPYVEGMSFGYFSVEAGKTYTVSMTDPLGFHPDHPIYCRDASGFFLGIDHTIGPNPGMSNPPSSVTWTGNSKVTFTIDPGSAIAYIGLMAKYSIHTTNDFERVIYTIQAEEGAVQTPWQPYSASGYIAYLKEQSLPRTENNVPSLPVSVTKDGNNLYIRGTFDASYDLIQLVQLGNTTPFTNNDTVNVQGARKALKGVTDNAVAWTGGTVLASQGDSTAPLNYNNTYIAGNHGAFIVREVTATAHGKTVEDVGSTWTDGAAVVWTLMRIVDANKLWFVSANTGVYPAWSFTLTITGATLTHSSGGTHTSAITIDSSVQTQLWPCLQRQTKSVLLDGTTPVTDDGTYRCNTLTIVNTYDVANPADVVAYVQSQVGSPTQPSFIDPSIDADVRRTLTYTYAENGSCEILDGIHVLNPLTVGYFGATQAEPLTYVGKQLWEYIPRVTPVVGSLGTWDFQAQANIGGAFEAVVLDSAHWTDPSKPPDRMAQIVKSTGGVNEFGMMVGYSPVRSVGLDTERITLINTGMFVSAIRKQYPYAVNLGPWSANTYYEIVAFRSYWAASANAQATVFTWYRDNDNVIVVADFHQHVSFSPLILPPQFNGMNVSPVQVSANAIVHGNGVVTPGGILVSVTGGYGYVVLQLT